jgi:hypothetical protein
MVKTLPMIFFPFFQVVTDIIGSKVSIEFTFLKSLLKVRLKKQYILYPPSSKFYIIYL